MRADLFELANVGFLFILSREQRPDFPNLFTLDVKQAGAFGRVKPLMQRSREVVAIEIRLFEIKLRERMCAIDDRLHAMPPRHLTNRFDRSDLPGEIDLMRNLNQPRARCNRALERRGDLFDVFWRNGNLD